MKAGIRNNATDNVAGNANEDIHFEEMSMNSMWGAMPHLDKPSGKKKRPKPVEGYYDSIADEILEKCDPRLFLKDYDFDKVRVANEICVAARNINDNREARQLRKRAQTELGVKFSTRALFDELTDWLYPELYVGKANFDYANELYNQVLMNADNVDALEEIKDKVLAEKQTNGIKFVKPSEPDRNNGLNMFFITISVTFLVVILFIVMSYLINCYVLS